MIIRFLLLAAILACVTALGAIYVKRARPLPAPPPSVVEEPSEPPARKADRIIPLTKSVETAHVAVEAKPPPKAKATEEGDAKPRNVCERHGMTKRETRRGWRCVRKGRR